MQINYDNSLSITERILKIIDNKDITKYKFCKDLGVSKGFLDKPREISTDKYANILSYFPDISPEWLLTGNGSMFRDETPEATEIQPSESNNAIPFVSLSVVAGFGSADFKIEATDVKAYYVVPKFKDRKIDFMIEVAGSSMYPKYNSGDVIACKIIRESQFIQWNRVHVIATKEQGLVVKRIKENGEHSIMAISDNKDYPPFAIPMDEIAGIALVVGVIRLE